MTEMTTQQTADEIVKWLADRDNRGMLRAYVERHGQSAIVVVSHRRVVGGRVVSRADCWSLFQLAAERGRWRATLRHWMMESWRRFRDSREVALARGMARAALLAEIMGYVGGRRSLFASSMSVDKDRDYLQIAFRRVYSQDQYFALMSMVSLSELVNARVGWRTALAHRLRAGLADMRAHLSAIRRAGVPAPGFLVEATPGAET